MAGAAVGAGCEWRVVAVVAVGGGLGSLARWGVGLILPHHGAQWPWATLLANVTGCFLLGALLALTGVRGVSALARPFIGVGLLGGWTTFSAWLGETLTLATADGIVSAGGYLLATLVLGLVAAGLGIQLFRRSDAGAV